MKTYFVSLFIFIAGISKAQYLDSIRIVNSSNITSNDTVRVKVYGYLPDTSWYLTSESSSSNSNTIEIVINFCSNTTGISVLINYFGNKKISPLIPGMYNLKVKFHGYSLANSVPCNSLVTRDSLSTSFQVLPPNAVIENINDAEFKIFPCPASDKLNLIFNVSQSSIKEVYISNITGQKLIEINSPNIKQEVDITSLKNGIYFLNVSTKNQKKTYKFIKE